jgi:transcriptional regulator with XRE-family HTH domain
VSSYFRTRQGINIKRLRLEKNYTCEGLASEIGINKTSLSRIENGLSDIAISRLVQIANCLHVEIDEIIPVNKTVISVHDSPYSINNCPNATQNNYTEPEMIKILKSSIENLNLVIQNLNKKNIL